MLIDLRSFDSLIIQPSPNEDIDFNDHDVVKFSKICGLIHTHIPKDVERFEISWKNTRLSFGFTEIDLVVDVNFAQQSQTFHHYVENHELPRRVVDNIRVTLREYLAKEPDFSFTAIREPLVLYIGLRILRLVEEATSHVLSYRQDFHISARRNRQLLTVLSGVDLSLTDDIAAKILGKTPAQICESLLEDWQVLHCENVVRRDLCKRFLSKQRQMTENLFKVSIDSLRRSVPPDRRRLRGGALIEKEGLVSYLVQPKVTFHGTPRQHVASIVQCGFFKPGDRNLITGKPHEVRCGSTYGAGVYTSPNPAFSLSYSQGGDDLTPIAAIPGLKLIVCATIMGRSARAYRADLWRERSEPFLGADSLVANNEMEYIVFDTAQVLPCYVFHLDWREQPDIQAFLQAKMKPKPLHKRLRKEQEALAPGDVQRIKEERMAQAKKFFAYGFGPLKGRDIVIEEIGEADDDEEDYGDYQKYRTNGDTGGSVWEWDQLEGGTEFDEYNKARRAKLKRE